MSSQHKAPLAAFLVVTLACLVVVVNAVRSDARGLLPPPLRPIMSALPFAPSPGILEPRSGALAAIARAAKAAEAAKDSKVAGALAGAPEVVEHVVRRAARPTASVAAPSATRPHRHRADHHRAGAGISSSAAAPAVTPATASGTSVAPPPQQPAPTVTHHLPEKPGGRPGKGGPGASAPASGTKSPSAGGAATPVSTPTAEEVQQALDSMASDLQTAQAKAAQLQLQAQRQLEASLAAQARAAGARSHAVGPRTRGAVAQERAEKRAEKRARSRAARAQARAHRAWR